MFITSVIMVVVMAIALTTSSLAWFQVGAANQVTTTALTINAKAETSSGIQISSQSAAGAWHSSATLNGAAAVNNLMPLLPNADHSSLSSDGPSNIATGATKLLAALDNDSETTASFIANTTDQNGDYDGNSTTSTGYFKQQLWITNIAKGSTATAVRITPTCAFTYSGAAYTSSTTGYGLHPTLYVAVLAEDSNGDYEIVNIFSSKDDTTVKVGKDADAFAAGESVATSYVTYDIADMVANSGATSDTLAAPVGNADYGVAKSFSVIAWYDGTTLFNSNSGFSIDFALTFTAANVS